MRVAATALALCAGFAALPAAARDRIDISPDYDPAIHWMEPPTRVAPGQARIRIVQGGRESVAALGPDQFWYYEEIYRRALARLSLTMPVDHAEPRARLAAFRAVLTKWPRTPVEGFALVDLEPRPAGGLSEGR